VGGSVWEDPVPPGNPDSRAFQVRLFAELEDGWRIVDPRPAPSFSVTTRLPRGARSLSTLRYVILNAIVEPEVTTDCRSSRWSGLVEELKEEGVGVDPETLRALPVHVHFTPELIERFGMG
jgi:hypothetical protein